MHNVLDEYMAWLDERMRYFYRNPQVCQTYYECLVRLQTSLCLPITKFEVPEDNS